MKEKRKGNIPIKQKTKENKILSVIYEEQTLYFDL
jgi:hypothetical protein